MDITENQFFECVDKMKFVDIVDTFSQEWFDNHKNVIIANVYLHGHRESIECVGNEYINAITINKFEVLLKELITTYFVRFIKFDEKFKLKYKNNLSITNEKNLEQDPISNITSYALLYHEMAILNIFEIILLNDSIYENIDNHLINLFAYLYSNLVAFLKTDSADYFVKPLTEMTIDEMLKEENDKTYYIDKLKIYLNVLTVLRNITNRIHLLSNSVINKIIDYDILLILIPLMEKAPWRHKDYTFVQNEWVKCDRQELADAEKQLWIIFYCLIMNRICQEKYEMTNYRRENILKLRKYMNECLYQQIPPVKTLHTFIEHLYISKNVFPECKQSCFIIDVVPEIFEDIKNDTLKNKKNILAILDKVEINREVLGSISDVYFSVYEFDQKYQKQELSRAAKERKEVDVSKNAASTNVSKSRVNDEYKKISEEILEEEYRCNFCNEEAELQCSQCKNTYYCSKECQMNDWYKHRQKCVPK